MSEEKHIVPGAMFGKWQVLGEVEKNKHGAKVYRCRCVCGTEKNIASNNLLRGDTTQCLRCYTRKRRKMNIVRNSCS
jgi:PII-like signaling protein